MRRRPSRGERVDYPPPVVVPIKTQGGMNAREHPMQRHRRVQRERQWIALALQGKPKPPLPCVVSLTRVSPGNTPDDDNVVSCLKATRDQIAKWLRVDDGERETVRYRYASLRGPWAVRIEFAPPVAGQQMQIEVE